MNNSERLKTLVESGRSVFTPADLRMLWRTKSLNAKISAIRMVEKKLLMRLATGYYVLNDRYNRYELANRMLAPSYVSFHSALFYAGINFQMRDEIASVALRDHRRKIGDTLYTYAAMKKTMFFNSDGVVTHEGAAIALPEHAVLDSLYFGYLPDVDDREKLNRTFLKKLSLSYPKSVQKKAKAFL